MLAATDRAVRIEQDRCNVRARGPGRRVAPATAGMTTPAAAVLSHELTRERGDNSRDLLAVSWETEDQFLQLITIGEELRPRRFGDLQPRLHASPHGLRKTHAVCTTIRFLFSENTSGCQQKKVPGLGKHMPCANKRFLVSDKTCRLQEQKVLGLGKHRPCATKKRFLVSKKPCRVQKIKVRFQRNW